MALLDLPLPYPAAHVVEQRAPYASGFPGGSSSNGSSSNGSSSSISSGSTGAATIPTGDSLGGRRGEMQTTSLKASASSGSLAPPPGLPRSSSTAELVALGFDVDANGNELSNDGGGGGGGGGYDPRPPAPALSNNGSGSMVGSTNGGGLEGGGEMGGGGGGGGGIGTGSAGGMGLGLRNHSLTNLANMVRSQSVSSFHSDIFAAGGTAARSTAAESPAWGSYPANLDKMGGAAGGAAGDAFTTSPSMGPRGPGRGMAAMRPLPAGGGGGGGDGGGADLSPPQFAGRGTAARREVAERGVAGSSATAARASQSQRRPMGGGGGSFDHRGGGVPSGPGGGAPTSGRAMVHNRSDTDLVASFSRLGFGQGGVSRWSPLMSPTASPLGAPLLEEDPLDLELEENSRGGRGTGGADTFGAPSSFLTSHGRRGLLDGGGSAGDASGMEVRLPRHASYPSLSVSRGGGGGGPGGAGAGSGGGYGMEDLVHGALEHLTAGDSATGGAGVCQAF